MRVFHPECLAKQDYKKSEGSILTLCDIHYLVFVSQLAGCQLIYPPHASPLLRRKWNKQLKIFSTNPPTMESAVFIEGGDGKDFRQWG